jgi:biopolymer transport protein TolQ
MLLAATDGIDLIDVMRRASLPGQVVLGLLVLASLLVWMIWLAKWLQLGRLSSLHQKLERAAAAASSVEELVELAGALRSAPGSQVIRAVAAHLADRNPTPELMLAVAKRAIAAEEQRATTLMPTLSSIASSSPFIGLFGTVWGIMLAFQRIGLEKSASLPVVAPAIGEALIATAFGLVAAIPATIGYNYIDRRIADLTEELSASSEVWVAQMLASRRAARG